MRFEIEKDGRRFEIEAPNAQAAMQAVAPHIGGGTNQEQPEEASVAGFIQNAGRDVSDIAGGLYQAVRHPIDTASAVIQNPSTLVQPYVDMASDPAGYAYENPVSAALNVSGIAGLGRSALTRAGMAAKTASTLGKVEAVTNPFNVALKGAQHLSKGAGVATRALVGQTSGTHGAVKVAQDMGKESAYSRFAANPPEGPKAFKEGMQGAGDETSIHTAIERGRDEYTKAAQNEIEAIYGPLKQDRTSITGVTTGLRTSLDKARKLAYPPAAGGRPIGGASEAVYKKLVDEITPWLEPNPNVLASAGRQRTGAYPPELASQYLTAKEIIDMGGDPATWTANDYVRAWADKSRSFEALDKLKQAVSKVYPGYTKAGGAPDRTAAKMAATVVDDIKDMIRRGTKARHGDAYDQGQAAFKASMDTLKEFDKAFGLNMDTRTRRIISMNRDGVFTNFGARIKMFQRIAQKAPSLRNIAQTGAGMSMKSWQPRNLVSGGIGVGLAALGGQVTNPLTALWVMVHVPRLVGKGAYGFGKVQGWITKPLEKIVRFMEAKGVNPMTATKVAGYTGTEVSRQKEQQELRNAIASEADKAGYDLHPRVIDKIARQLLSDDVDEFMRGLKTATGHKRLMELFARTKGEQ